MTERLERDCNLTLDVASSNLNQALDLTTTFEVD
jgi:hypothetical protein